MGIDNIFLSLFSLDKPVVLISLHHTVNPESVLKISGFEYRRNICPVECIFLKGKGLLDCPINREEISAVLSFLKKTKTKVTTFLLNNYYLMQTLNIACFKGYD